jgi:outer membrane lipoprotein-sorting protein
MFKYILMIFIISTVCFSVTLKEEVLKTLDQMNTLETPFVQIHSKYPNQPQIGIIYLKRSLKRIAIHMNQQKIIVVKDDAYILDKDSHVEVQDLSQTPIQYLLKPKGFFSKDINTTCREINGYIVARLTYAIEMRDVYMEFVFVRQKNILQLQGWVVKDLSGITTVTFDPKNIKINQEIHDKIFQDHRIKIPS